MQPKFEIRWLIEYLSFETSAALNGVRKQKIFNGGKKSPYRTTPVVDQRQHGAHAQLATLGDGVIEQGEVGIVDTRAIDGRVEILQVVAIVRAVNRARAVSVANVDEGPPGHKGTQKMKGIIG